VGSEMCIRDSLRDGKSLGYLSGVLWKEVDE